MIFFINRCKNRNCPLLKLHFQPSTIIIIHWRACIKGSFPPTRPIWLSKWISIISSSSVALALLKSLGTSYGRAGFWPATESKITKKLKLSLLCPFPASHPFPVQFSHHYQIESHTVRRAMGQAPAPRSGSVDEELLGSQQREHMQWMLVVYCWASV